MNDEALTCRHCGLPVPPDRRAAGGLSFCCFGCRIAHDVALPAAQSAAGTARSSTLLLRLGLGIFLSLNIMVASWFFYSEEWFGAVARADGLYAGLTGLFSYLALFLCTLVVAMLGLPLLADAARHLAARRVTTHLLIVLGVFSAYALSAVHTLQGKGSLYYDTAAVVLVIVTLGSYLEAGAKRRAAASAGELLAALPAGVRARRGDEVVEMARDQVRTGDHVRVLPGETVPVDGRVAEGTSRVDEASLTGESRGRSVEVGDRLLAGSVSLDGQLWVRTERAGDDTVLALMERSLDEARRQKPSIQRLADRVASVFVPAVAVLALGVFAWRTAQGNVASGLLASLSVLLISCPCALGLAAPLACWNALRRAADLGILIDSPATLERAAEVDRVFFDKTGTLTRPELRFDRVWTAPDVDPREAFEWAASLESASVHPIARALLTAAKERGIEPRVPESASTVPGRGVEGRLDHRMLRLGSGRWLGRDGSQDDGSSVFLMDGERVLARFDLEETPRPDAAAAIEELRQEGIEVGILSGDRAASTRRLAECLDVEARGELLPDDKVKHLTRARAAGRIAMVGDGLNDAPVLAAADVGIALGSASDLAKQAGNVRLTSDRLDRVPLVFAIARDTRRRIRANLAWAFGFNSVGIVLAAAGWLTPVFAAVAMVASSLMVVRISSRAGAEPRSSASRALTPQPGAPQPGAPQPGAPQPGAPGPSPRGRGEFVALGSRG